MAGFEIVSEDVYAMTTTESPVERRKRETLERCTTDAQRATCERLHAGGKSAYPKSRQGKTVVGEFRRYCETLDAEKIGPALYDFSIYGAGGLNDIAHYNLHGFRHEYPHPALYVERLLYPEANRERDRLDEDPSWFHSQYVYTDGMTNGEVLVAILAIADEKRGELLADIEDKALAAKRAKLEALASELGVEIVS